MTMAGQGKWVALSAVAAVAAAVFLPWIGPSPIEFSRVVAHQQPDYLIFMELRLSRTLLGLLVGASLSLAGALFQALLRDSLATPYTLGISSGASFGAILTITSGLPSVAGLPAVWVGALLGATAALVIVAGASAQRGQLSSFRLLLTGISLNGVFSALILMVHSTAREYRSISVTHWLLGSLDSIRYSALTVFAVVASLMAAILLSRAKHWNLLMVGEDWAATRGVDPQRLLRLGFVCGSVLTATAVALAGPIGFVGLIVPHIVRARISADYRILMPCSFFLGGVLLAAADAAGRIVLAPAELPAGAIMALLGGPYLVWLVRRRS